MMFEALLHRDEPMRIEDDGPLQETERAWKDAQAEQAALAPRYARLKALVNQPANMTLDDLHATSEEQDEAFGTFSDVARRYHDLSAASRRTRLAYESARVAATAVRQTWYTDRLRAKERALVEVIGCAVFDIVQEIHDLIEEAGREGVRVEPTQFGDVPLRMGNSRQGGLEAVVETLKTLINKP